MIFLVRGGTLAWMVEAESELVARAKVLAQIAPDRESWGRRLITLDDLTARRATIDEQDDFERGIHAP